MARSNIFTHGYVVGILVLSRGDSDDEGRLPDAVASPNRPVFTRLQGQYKLPLPTPEAGAAGAFVSHAKITTAVIDTGPHVGQLTSDLDANGAVKPNATPGVELVVGAYRVDLGLGYSPQTFDIDVTEEHTQAAPLDLYSAAPYAPEPGTPVTTVLLPSGAAVGDVLTFGTDGAEWAAPTGGEGGGVADHGELTGRSEPDQHPIAAVTGLQDSLDGKVDGDDPRLSDERDPTEHQHNYSDISDPPDLSDVVRDDDPRLSDAREPTEHNHDGRYYTESEVDAALEGKADRPSHESILASGNVTLPVDHPVLTIRADDPATLAVPEAPDGTVLTIHVAHGWENLTWAPGITITGDSTTTETWVVLVRKEGAWSALVSGSGGGGLTGHGRPDGKSWPNGDLTMTQGPPIIAPLGTTYTDLDWTDGALQWMVTGLGYIWWFDPDGTTRNMEDGPIWEVTAGQAWWMAGSESYYPNPLAPPAGYDDISIEATRRGDWVDVQVRLIPSGVGQGEAVTVPAVEFYSFGPPDFFAPAQYGDLPMEVGFDPDFMAAVGEPPQARLSGISNLSIPSFEIGAFTGGEYFEAAMTVRAEYRIKEFLAWPVQMEWEPDGGDDGGGGGAGI